MRGQGTLHGLLLQREGRLTMPLALLAQECFGALQLDPECVAVFALLRERVLELGNFGGVAGLHLRNPGIRLFVQAAGQPAYQVLNCLAHRDLGAAGPAFFLLDLLQIAVNRRL